MNRDYHHHFNLPFLQAIRDWQRGGDATQNLCRGQRLKEVCAPREFLGLAFWGCFRQIALGKRSVWDLIGGNRLAEKVSSWTLDVEVAKEFKNGVPPEGQGYQRVIFFVKPSPGSVIVNLRVESCLDVERCDFLTATQPDKRPHGFLREEMALARVRERAALANPTKR